MPLRAIQPRGPDTRGCAAVRPPGSAVLTQCPLANVCRRSSLVRAGPTCVATAAPRQSDASVHTRRAAGFALKIVYRSGAKAAKDARTNSSAPRAAVLATTARRSLPLWRRYISWTRQRHLLLNISTDIQEPARTSSSATERRGSRAACTVRYDGPSLLRFRPLFVHRIALSDAIDQLPARCRPRREETGEGFITTRSSITMTVTGNVLLGRPCKVNNCCSVKVPAERNSPTCAACPNVKAFPSPVARVRSATTERTSARIQA